MSVYNGERYLRDAIESILDQTFTDFEFIIVNDGSKDSTQEILQEFARHDSRFMIVHNEPNLGLTRSLNVGLRLAGGKYVARQDADDISLRNRLELQVRFLEEHPEVGVVGTWAVYIDEEGQKVGGWRTPTHSDLVRWSLLFGNVLAHASVMIRRSVLQGGMEYRSEVQYAQDYDLWSRLSARTELRNLPEPLLLRRVHSRMIGTQQFESQEHASVCVMQHMISNLLGEDVPKTLVSTLRKAARNECLGTEKDLREVASLIRRLYQVYPIRRNLRPTQRNMIAEDASDRLASLATRHAAYWPVSAIWVMLLSLYVDRRALSRRDFLRSLSRRLRGA